MDIDSLTKHVNVSNGNGGGSNGVSKGGPLSRTWPQLFKRRRTSAGPAVTPYTTPENGARMPPVNKLPIPKTLRGSVSTVGTTQTLVADNASTNTGSTQANLLASKSNYEWIAEGRHAEMGLHFSTTMATGVMMRRATHRAAEQARRDRMKSAMVDLAEFLLDGEVTFGSGTSCFVVDTADLDGMGENLGADETVKIERGGKRGRNINKARIIEMALEKMRAQEKEIEILREGLVRCGCAGGDEVRMVMGTT